MLVNAYHVKHIPGKKTDQKDSEWLAQLLRSHLIKPSYVPDKHIRNLRELTRTRVKIVQARTGFKNRVHKILSRCSIKLSSVLDDIFSVAGREILNGLMEGMSVKQILERSNNKTLKNKRRIIENTIKGALGQSEILLLRHLTEIIEKLDQEVESLDYAIHVSAKEEDVEII